MAVVFLWSGRIIPFCHLSLWLLADIKRFGRILIPLGGDVFHFAGVCGRFHGGVGVSFFPFFFSRLDRSVVEHLCFIYLSSPRESRWMLLEGIECHLELLADARRPSLCLIVQATA
jgi:hypothetical protein